jgi:hypothetical protein
MKKRALLKLAILTAILGGLQTASAQLALGIDCSRHRYISYEKINLTITLRNDSGNSLEFDGDDLLHISVINESGDMARKLREPGTILKGLKLASGTTRSISFALNTYYAMQNESDYEVYVQVGHPRLRSDFRSNRLLVEVRSGTVVWTRTFGLPALRPNSEITSRQATLLRFQEKEGEIYCLRIEDRDSVYSVFRLARRIIGSEPEGEVDALGNIHVLLRIKARLFLYHVYSYNGELKQEKLYAIEETQPSLYRDPQLGKVAVIGGRPALRGVDYLLPGDTAPLLEETAPVLEPL